MKADNREIKELDDITHLLLRPNTFIGSVKPADYQQWILSDNKIELKTLNYTEGLNKIISEILENSLDEGIKTDWKYSNKISVDIKDNKTITITDNGRGLPCKKTDKDEWMPVVAFTKLRAGSNFEDNGRVSVGVNGFGAALTNAFSKYFEVVTCDGKAKLKIVCKDNLSNKRHMVLTATEKTGTKVEFTPDYERFGCKELQKDIITMLKTRLTILSIFYPKCSFYFNGEKVNIKAKGLSELFNESNVVLSNDYAYVCIYPTDEPLVFSYVNGINLRRGGNHVDYILNKIISDIREKVGKKYKNIKPADIRNRLGISVLLKDFPNCQFDSQTKETLTNSASDISEYFKSKDFDLDKLSGKVLNKKELLDNITEMFRLKEELAEKKALKNSNKKKDIDSEKYFPPISNSGNKFLMITEGYSAFSGISPILGRKSIGYYSLKGKPLNLSGLSASKFMQNQEISDLVNILGIDLEHPEKTDLNFEYIVVLSDADNDGIHIAALLCEFIERLCPNIFNEHRFCYLRTPVIIESKGNKVAHYYFDLADYSNKEHDSRLVCKYVKGLGSHTKEQLNQVIEMEGGMENLLQSYTKDDLTSASIENWLGNDSNFRKDKLRGKEFHIDGI